MTKTKTLHPNIDVYPACTNCGEAFVLRRSMVINLATNDLRVGWAWQRDCHPKTPCKKAPAELRNADGSLYESGDSQESDA